MLSFHHMMYPGVANSVLQKTAAPSSGATSETQSEISSADSDWSDIRAIATKLGVQNPDELHTERFKVDRHKLENMIKVESIIDGLNSAEYFFEIIMKTMQTHISWPCRLKIGAKSKKDPHVRIVGKPEDVQRAKERVLASLDSRGTRVIMKMDVSYTDHSYIIGRGGNNIKRIMEDTATHIHFPDSNRSNPTEKSNQVSLCGSLEGVERARSLVRLSTPLLISFELPVMAPGRLQPDHETPYVKMIETKYNVQVIFSSRPKLHSSLVLVKGSEKEATHVQEATYLLIDFTCENIASQILVNMQLEISPQHHEIVKGKNNSNLLSIMERTKTKIIFPDVFDANVKPIKKSQVTITGTIGGVYRARQQLLGNLPITLIFDFPDTQNDASEIMGLSTKYGVFISLRQKQRQSTLAIVIKGVEKFIDKIYEARHEILSLNTSLVKPEIPETYFAPNDEEMGLSYRTSLTSLLSGYPDSPKTPNYITTSTISTYGNNNNLNNNNPNMLNNNSLQFSKYMGTPTGICAPTQKYMQLHNNNFNNRQQPSGKTNNNNNYLPMVPPAQPTSTSLTQSVPPTSSITLSPRQSSCGNNTSGYQSFSSSSTSLEQAYPPFGVAASAAPTGAVSSGGIPAVSSTLTHYSPDSTYGSDIGGGGCARVGRRSSDGVLLGLGASGPIGNLLNTGPASAESFRNLHFDVKHQNHHIQNNNNNFNRTFDFIDMKRAMGFKAMEQAPISGEIRTPNQNWMGLSLSHTSPAAIETVDDIAWNRHSVGGMLAGMGGRGHISPYGLSATTGIVDSTPTNRRLQLAQHKDIHTLLTSLGLDHYIKTFVMNEIDMEMFTTLTEENLMELGITAFGARKKILVAIHTLQANEATNNTMMPASTTTTTNNVTSPRFSGSAAPGAERRPSNQW